jgi:hypothetical protein
MDKTLSDAVAVANEAGLTDRDLATLVEAATQARRDAAEQTGVAMVHPDLPDRPIHVDPEAVELHQQAGWSVLTDEPDVEEPKPAKAAKAAPKKES